MADYPDYPFGGYDDPFGGYDDPSQVRCAFCGKTRDQVRKLVRNHIIN